ncbi:DUF4190 domain-containing protein [Spirosoma pollinicola]|uniref:DUF4190 domain-containing protein n=1 Tax=Spirosoma pollinicola TaxID=2057025 RepID=UPI0012FDDA6B|nr:DUF4190 domain-containing protein [Spirosoma pollinicola]
MKKRFLYVSEIRAFAACQERGLLFSRLAFLIILIMLGGLSSCQRASTAYFAPTPHPAPQRLAISTPAIGSIPDSSATASLIDSPPVATKPIWEISAPAPEAAIATTVRRSTLLRRARLLLPHKPIDATCDQIVLRNGDVIEAKVKEVAVNEIRYKKCDRPNGPDYTISKRDVLSIKYSTGEVERFTSGSNSSGTSSSGSSNSYNSPTSPQNDGPRTDPFAIVAISAGGLAIFTGLGSLLLGAAAVVFGALSLARIRKEPNRFKGKGLALAGMVIGIVAAAAILLYVYVI